MKTAAVICELNPMHSGHEYIFAAARKVVRGSCIPGEKCCVAAVMSGNFTQRSEAAIYDKYTRAKAAVVCGSADIVLELPFPWCCASAEYFASAGVYIAASVGADYLVFGSECGDEKMLNKAAEALDSDEYTKLFMEEKLCNPAAGAAEIKERALHKIIGVEARQMLSPNDILGTEYIRAAKKLGGRITCVPVKRIAGEKVKSASEIRKTIRKNGSIKCSELNGTVNDAVSEVLYASEKNGNGPVNDEIVERIIFENLRLRDKNSFSTAAECSGGVMERILNSAAESVSYKEFMQKSRTKKYTDSRIRRSTLFAISDVKKDIVNQMPKFTYLLAAGMSGTLLLSTIPNDLPLKIITKPASAKKLSDFAADQLRLNAFVDNIYSLSMPKTKPAGFFVRSSPCIINDTMK